MVNTVTIVGKKQGKFKAEDGKEVIYGRLFVLYDEDLGDETQTGQGVGILKLDLDSWNSFEIGCHGTPFFNQYGKCIDFKEG